MVVCAVGILPLMESSDLSGAEMNEPVAWMVTDKNTGVSYLQIKKPTRMDEVAKKYSPLYTHPVKTLTEIIEKNKPEIEKANAYIKLLEDEIQVLKGKTLTDGEIIELLAELEHEQWMAWAKNLKDTEALSIERLNRWIHCFKPYSELSEEMKEHDRVWARKALAILRKAQEK